MDSEPRLTHGIREFDLPLLARRAFASPVPPRALVISFGALGVALAASLVPAEVTGDYRALAWSLALIPALLLAFHRGWRIVGIFLALGMAVLALSPLAAFLFDLHPADWPFSVLVLSVYIAIALGGGWFSEVRDALRTLRRTEDALQRAYEELTESHRELQNAHVQMVRTNQLDATGQLAAGVAHEVKNPLMTLLAGIQYLQTFGNLTKESEKQLLDDMWLAVKRADSVVRGLLDFSREQELFWREDKPNDLVERTLGLVRHEIERHHITVTCDYEEDLPPVTMDCYRIQQVLINLISNAADAMDDGGSLTIRTRRGKIPATTSGSGEVEGLDEPLDGVALVVEDTGPGIPAEVFDKIFEPFFTTKGAEHGSGLGLAVSQRLVRMHGGMLKLENHPKGARATVLIPLKPEGAEGDREVADTVG